MEYKMAREERNQLVKMRNRLYRAEKLKERFEGAKELEKQAERKKAYSR
jgi:hypothetical protein